MIFHRDTVLYHPVEGKRLFPQGEQHPGPAWFDNKECVAPSENAPELARQLEAALNTVSRLQTELEAASSQVAGQARAFEQELAARQARMDAAGEAYDAEVQRLEREIDRLVAQRDAAAGKPAAAPAADPFDHDGKDGPGGSLKESEDPDAQEKAAIRRELDQLGADKPHPRMGVAKLREALRVARAAASAPE